MAQENISFQKTIISNKRSNETLSKQFDKLAKSEEFIDQKKIEDTYNHVFYNIPKKGETHTHQSIIEQSHNLLFENENDILDLEIDKKVQDLADLNEQLTSLELGDGKENELYEDGAFLMAGESPDQEPYQDQNTVWVMQEGRKRPIGDVNIYDMIRKSFDLIPGEKTGIYYLTIDELNLIPDGVGINNYSDLHLKGNDIITEDTDLILPSAYYNADFVCDGVEIADTYDIFENTNSAVAGQFYLVNGGCSISYLVDNGTIDDVEPTIETLSLSRGESVTNITFVRDTGVGNSAIPMDIDSIYFNYPPTDVVDENGIQVNYTKLWGPGKRYSGIVHVSGRVRIKENIPVEEDFKVLNGVPAEIGLPGNYELVDGNTLTTITSFGTKRIFPPNSNKHGALNQSEQLQQLFNLTTGNPFKYYHPSVNYGGNPDAGGTNDEITIDLRHDPLGPRLSATQRVVTGANHTINIGNYYNNTSYLQCNLYGQPIIQFYPERVADMGDGYETKWWASYFVVVGMYNKQWTVPIIGGNVYHLKVFLLYNLSSGRIVPVLRSIMNDAINLKMETNSSGRPQKIKWQDLNTDAIAYVGLKGHTVLGHNTNSPNGLGTDNPFNSSNGGSNTFLNSVNTP